MPLWGWIVIAAIVLIAIFLIFTYNGLVRLRNMVDEAWNQISVQLKRRHDLIPNLVNAVKGYMDFEQETLTRVIEARNQAVTAQQAGPGNAAQAGQGAEECARTRLGGPVDDGGDGTAADQLVERHAGRDDTTGPRSP